MESYLATIILFAGNFAPRGWAFCDGQLLPIERYQAVYSLVGTTYGGDGRTTFALPDLRGRAPIHPGAGAGLTPRALGEALGSETVTLSPAEMPAHSHEPCASGAAGSQQSPVGAANANEGGAGIKLFGKDPDASMLPTTSAGGGMAHNNMQPSLGINYIFCIEGIYPSRS